MLCNNGSNNFPRFFVVPLSWDCELWGAGCVICRYPHYLFTPSAIFTFNRWYTFSPFTSSAGNLSPAIKSKNQTALLNQNLLSYKPRWVVPAHLIIGSKKDTPHHLVQNPVYLSNMAFSCLKIWGCWIPGWCTQSTKDWNAKNCNLDQITRRGDFQLDSFVNIIINKHNIHIEHGHQFITNKICQYDINAWNEGLTLRHILFYHQHFYFGTNDDNLGGYRRGEMKTAQYHLYWVNQIRGIEGEKDILGKRCAICCTFDMA